MQERWQLRHVAFDDQESSPMKLRLKSNILRFRTTQSEVSRLLELGHLEETIQFDAADAGALTFAIVLESDAICVQVRYARSTITLLVPAAEARMWGESDAVGIYATVQGGNGPLELILEKDFACLDRSDVENHDAFPNPQAEARYWQAFTFTARAFQNRIPPRSSLGNQRSLSHSRLRGVKASSRFAFVLDAPLNFVW
jgi:hypothetical protein